MYDLHGIESFYTVHRNCAKYDVSKIKEYAEGLRLVLNFIPLDQALAEKIIFIMDLCLITNGPDDVILSAIYYCENYLDRKSVV